jgi:hypothetical protein
MVPGVGELAVFQPGSGIAMRFDDLKVIGAQRLVTSLTTGQPYGATIHDAVRAAAIVDAILVSTASRGWVAVPPGEAR